MTIDIKKIRKIDNELTYVVAHRNMYHYAVIVLALWYLFMTPSTEIQQAAGVILLVLGFKWMLWQIRENIDTIVINKQYMLDSETKVDKK